MSGVIRRDEARVRAGADAVFYGNQVPINTGIWVGGLGGVNGNGFYWDGSERAHNFFATVMHYGIDNVNSHARMMTTIGGETLNGVPITFNPEGQARMMSVLDQAYLTSVWRGALMPGMGGRRISRDHFTVADFEMAATMAQMIPAFPPDVQVTVQEHVRSWAMNNPDLMRTRNLSRNDMLRGIALDDSITPREWSGIFAQNHQSRAYYRSEDFVFGISFNNHNANTAPHTAINNENRRGVFAGEGMNYLHLDNDQLQYGGNFFAHADFFRLPGTTVGIRPDWAWAGVVSGAPNTNRNPQHTHGGTAALRAKPGGMQNHIGEIGVTSFRQNFATAANKSWFMLDGRIIAIGTNINATTAWPVATSVDQRRRRKSGFCRQTASKRPLGG